MNPVLANSLRVFSIACLIGAAGAADGAVISLRSGQSGGVPGLPGMLDDIVTLLPTNPPGGPVSAVPFTPADFAGAASGPAATVINPHPAWTPTISDPLARWINYRGAVDPTGQLLGAPGSTLYAVPFFVPGSGPLAATLTLELAVDDALGDWLVAGDPNPAGVYMNGAALPLYTAANYATPTTYSTPITVNGGATNYMYLYQRDLGVLVSGLIFSAKIDVVPTPGFAGLAVMSGLVAVRRKR